MRLQLKAQLVSQPGGYEASAVLRQFTGKHRSTIGLCALQSVRYHYLPPHSSDPVATSKVREDVMVIHLRTRPNAEEARPEKRFFATDAHLETIASYFPTEEQVGMRHRLRDCREQASRSRGPSSVVLVVCVVEDPSAPSKHASVMPFAFSLDQTTVMGVAFQWREYLLHNLNEGIVH